MAESVGETLSAPPAERAGRTGWYVVGLCMVAYMFSFIDRQILSMLIGPVRADLHINDGQFGLLNGLAFAIFYATLGVPIASLADRVSRPMLIAAGICFWSAATIACGLAAGFGQLFLARICVGAGEAALSPATYSLISAIFPKERIGRALGVYSLGSFLGTSAAFLVGGGMISAISAAGDREFAGLVLKPWQVTFALVGAPGLLLAAMVALTVREPYEGGRRPKAEAQPSFAQVLGFLARHRAVWIPHMAGYSLAAMSLFTFLGWTPAYLMRTFGLTPQSSGLILGPMALLAGGGGVVTSGWLVDFFTRRGRADAPIRVGVIGAFGVVIPAALLLFAGSLQIAACLLALTLFFASFPMVPSTAAMQTLPPQRMRARVTAIFLFCNSLGGMALGLFLVGLLNDSVFRTPQAIALSMPIVTSASALLSAIILATGMAPFKRAIGEAGG